MGERVGGSMRRAFTLTELVVVVAIIAVLAAIVFPVFASARESGWATSCAANLRSLGQAMHLYAGDADDRPAAAGLGPGRRGPLVLLGVGWAGRVFPYVKSPATFRCQSDSSSVEPRNLLGASEVSYALNSNLHGGHSLSSLEAGSRSVLLFEVRAAAALLDQTDEGWVTRRNGGGRQMSPAGDGVRGNLTESHRPFRIPSGSFAAFYATGRMANSEWSVPQDPTNAHDDYDGDDGRHRGRSRFLALDGHVAAVAGSRVGAGRTAASATAPATRTGCEYVPGTRRTYPCAAGTEVPGIGMTMSLR